MKTTGHVPTTPARSIDYRPDIDGLRALAVTLVVLVHAFPKYLQNGFIGVDVFFVISGFLITGILLTQLRAGSFSLKDFYVRRANRIFPALIVVLVACLGFGAAALYASEYARLGRSVAAGAGFVANVGFYFEGGYWDISAKLKPLLHLWSLGVEEQYYLFWPLMLWAVWTRRINLVAVFGALFVASLGWNLYVVRVDQPAAFYLPFSRFWELLAGGALAYAGARRATASKPLSNLCAFLGVALIGIALAERYPTEAFPGWHGLLPVLGTVLIIAAGPVAWFNARVLSRRFVIYIGLISFPLYLWHWPLLTFARILGNGELSIPFLSAALLLTVALSIATYHLVEKPIRTNPSGRGLKAIVLAFLLAVSGAGGYFVNAHDGVPARHGVAQVAAQPLPKIASTSKVVLIGDSNAGQYVPGLSAIYHDRLVPFTTPAWPYLDGVGYRPGLKLHSSATGSPKLTEETLARIVSDPGMDVVIMAHMYVVYMDQDQIRSYPTPRPGETGAMAYEAGLRRTARLLIAAGKKVVYVKSIPFRSDVASILACSPSTLPIPRKKPHDCLRSTADVRNSRVAYDQLVARAFDGIPEVGVFDPLPYLCDDVSCSLERDGVLLYGDTAHLSNTGSLLMSRELAKFIETRRARAQEKK